MDDETIKQGFTIVRSETNCGHKILKNGVNVYEGLEFGTESYCVTAIVRAPSDPEKEHIYWALQAAYRKIQKVLYEFKVS